MSTRAYRPFDNPAPENPSSILLNVLQLSQADLLVLQAAKLLNIDFKARPVCPRQLQAQANVHKRLGSLTVLTLQALPLTEKNYIRKNYFQVVNAEALFIVARILRYTEK